MRSRKCPTVLVKTAFAYIYRSSRPSTQASVQQRDEVTVGPVLAAIRGVTSSRSSDGAIASLIRYKEIRAPTRSQAPPLAIIPCYSLASICLYEDNNA